jgi:hypothetical protein
LVQAQKVLAVQRQWPPGARVLARHQCLSLVLRKPAWRITNRARLTAIYPVEVSAPVFGTTNSTLTVSNCSISGNHSAAYAGWHFIMDG